MTITHKYHRCRQSCFPCLSTCRNLSWWHWSITTAGNCNYTRNMHKSNEFLSSTNDKTLSFEPIHATSKRHSELAWTWLVHVAPLQFYFWFSWTHVGTKFNLVWPPRRAYDYAYLMANRSSQSFHFIFWPCTPSIRNMSMPINAYHLHHLPPPLFLCPFKPYQTIKKMSVNRGAFSFSQPPFQL